MVSDIGDFIKDCIHCLAMKQGKIRRLLRKVLIGEYPGEVIQIDHLSMNHKNHDQLLVIQDKYSS